MGRVDEVFRQFGSVGRVARRMDVQFRGRDKVRHTVHIASYKPS